MEFTVPLALLDFLPVLLTAIGFLFILRLITSILPSQGGIAFLGVLLIVLGGFFRALWKLLLAFSGGSMDIPWMGNGLFVFMAPGYILFSWSIWQVSRSLQGRRASQAWAIPFLLIVLLLATSYFLSVSALDSQAWKRILLSVAVLGNLLSGSLLVSFAFRQKLFAAGWLFLLNLVGVFLLNGSARLPEQSISLHWINETINLVAWLVFAIAARIVKQHVRRNLEGNFSVASRLSSLAK